MSCPECIKDLFPATTSNSAAERISKCNLSWFFSGLQLHVMNLVRRIYYCGRNKSLSPHRWDSCIGSCISRLQHLEPLQPGQSPVLRFSALLGSVLLPEPSLTGRGIWCSWAVVSKPTLSQNTSCVGPAVFLGHVPANAGSTHHLTHAFFQVTVHQVPGSLEIWHGFHCCWLVFVFFFCCFYYYYFIFHLSILDHLLGWQEALWDGPGTACALCSFLPNLILSSCLSHPGAASQHVSYPCSETSLLLFSCLKLLLLNESACTIPCKASAVFSDAPAPAGSRSWGSGSQQ